MWNLFQQHYLERTKGGSDVPVAFFKSLGLEFCRLITYVRPRPVGAVLRDLGQVLGVAPLDLVEVRLLLVLLPVVAPAAVALLLQVGEVAEDVEGVQVHLEVA